MAKKSSVNKNNRRRELAARYAAKRKRLKDLAGDLNKPSEERFAARLKLAEMPRNSAPSRIRNRCELTGRARGYYRKLKVCRNMLRELASQGLIPGMTKSSW
jgi:small subunit ribosomal protein S14